MVTQPSKGWKDWRESSLSADPFLVFKVLFPKGWLYIKTRLVGSYNLENALAAVTIGQYFGIEPSGIAGAIGSYQPDNNRSQMVVTERNQLLMDAYNANPTSTQAALENLKNWVHQKRGNFRWTWLELGSVSAEEHQKIVDYLTTMKLDRFILLGPAIQDVIFPKFSIVFHTRMIWQLF